MCDAVLMDVAGLCVAARNTDYVRAAIQATMEPGACTLIGHVGGFNVATAALCNGTAAHGEDYDDTFEGGPIHAGVVIIPALVATAEQHALAGKDLERGIAVGCEVMCRLCLVAPKRVHKAGFHPTAVFGALGAAGGVASAMRLDDARWVNALGIAGSMASGIIEYLAEGAWTKRMHPGWAAQAGYRAARMAQAGFTGPRTLLEGEHGFFHGFANSDGCDFTAMLEDAGRQWLCADIAFKPYACGTMAHPYIDCARKLVANGLRTEEIVSIECKTAEGIGTVSGSAGDQQTPQLAMPRVPAFPTRRRRDAARDAGLGDEEAVVHVTPCAPLAGKVRYVVDADNPYPRRPDATRTLRSGEVREASRDHFRRSRGTDVAGSAWKRSHGQLRVWRLAADRSLRSLRCGRPRRVPGRPRRAAG
jgi:2-methylcitrate dehydratase PrpD